MLRDKAKQQIKQFRKKKRKKKKKEERKKKKKLEVNYSAVHTVLVFILYPFGLETLFQTRLPSFETVFL
jgi:hypothetical protein